MILNKNEEFSDGDTLAAGATSISDNIVDTYATAVKDLGTGTPVYLVVQVDTTVTAAGAATVTITLESDSAVTSGDLVTAAVVHWSSGAIAKATLVAGYQKIIALPPEKTYKEFLGVRYTVATGPLTAGAFSAFLATGPQLDAMYPSGYTVS